MCVRPDENSRGDAALSKELVKGYGPLHGFHEANQGGRKHTEHVLEKRGAQNDIDERGVRDSVDRGEPPWPPSEPCTLRRNMMMEMGTDGDTDGTSVDRGVAPTWNRKCVPNANDTP